MLVIREKRNGLGESHENEGFVFGPRSVITIVCFVLGHVKVRLDLDELNIIIVINSGQKEK